MGSWSRALKRERKERERRREREKEALTETNKQDELTCSTKVKSKK